MNSEGPGDARPKQFFVSCRYLLKLLPIISFLFSISTYVRRYWPVLYKLSAKFGPSFGAKPKNDFFLPFLPLKMGLVQIKFSFKLFLHRKMRRLKTKSNFPYQAISTTVFFILRGKPPPLVDKKCL